MTDDREIVTGRVLSVDGLRVRLVTDDGFQEVEVDEPPMCAPVGAHVRVYGRVKLCEEWTREGMARAG